MKNRKTSENQAARRILLIASAAALAVAFNGPTYASGQRRHVNPPPVPTNIEAPVGHRAYLLGRAVGTQNYVCLPSGAGAAWAFFAPQATLFNDDDQQIITHFLSPNPDEAFLAARDVAGLPRHERRLGICHARHDLDRLALRRTGCDPLAPASGVWR